MGAACCVAARDRTIQHGSSGEILHRNLRHSPTWSFRWDNRVGIVEETSVGWLSDVANRNNMLDLKPRIDVSAHVSDGGASLENCRVSALHKSPLNQEGTKNPRTSVSGQPIARSASFKVKQSAVSPPVSDAASVKPFSPIQSTSSFCISPLSSQSHVLPPSPSPTQWAQGSPDQLAEPAFSCHSSGQNSPSMDSISGGPMIPPASNESTRGSYGRSSDGWSAYAFSELMSVSQGGGRWSFDSDSCSINNDKSSRASVGNSGSISSHYQTCTICSKLLTEKSAWSSQKIMAGNELSVVAILACGHVYHAECLETITPDINKYDPSCPVCTFGEKQTMKLSGKMLKAEKELKARKRSRSRVMDTDVTFDFNNWKNGAHEGRSPKLSTSSSLKISASKPFLRRHFSFGSRSNKSTSDNPSTKKKGLFWAKSSKE